jgi:M6 family metalloprotease-like protein
VILAEFPDEPHEYNVAHNHNICDWNECSPQYWKEKLFNDTLYEDLGNFSFRNWAQTNRTMHNYFNMTSYGKLNVTGEIVGMQWFIMPNSMKSYVNRWCALINDAVTAADPYFDFSAYNESNGNDKIIMVIHAGPAAETAGSAVDYIWSRAPNDCVPQYGRGINPVDGVTITRAAVVSETQGNKTHGWPQAPTESRWAMPTGIQYHELSHMLGFPDIYPNAAVYNWDLMDAGGYSNNGSTPNYFGAWTTLWAGWTTPQIILPGAVVNVTITDHTTFNGTKIVKVPIETEGSLEYFLLENRQRPPLNYQWDSTYGYYMDPLQEGLLVWHIKDSLGNAGTPQFPGNPDNNPPYGRRIFIEDKLVTNPVVAKIDDINAAFTEGYSFTPYSYKGTYNSTNSSMRNPSDILSNGGGPMSGVFVYNIFEDGNAYKATVKNALLPNVSFQVAINITSNASIPLILPINIACDNWLNCPTVLDINISAGTNVIQRFDINTSADYSDAESKKITAKVGSLNASGSVVTLISNPPDPNNRPVLTIVSPQNTTYQYNVTELDYTVSSSNLDSCWYSLDGGVTNVTIACNQNITGLSSLKGSNTWTVWVNTTEGTEVTRSVTFSVVIPGDAYEPDDTSSEARLITVNETQFHDFHNALDVDWVKFSVTENYSYTLYTSIIGSVDTQIYLFDEALNQIGYNDDYPGRSWASQICFTAASNATYYSELTSWGQGTLGNYNLTLVEGDLCNPAPAPEMRYVYAYIWRE